MHQKGLTVGTIRSTLSAISWHHKLNSKEDPTRHFLIMRLLLGIKKVQKKREKQVVPISHHILAKILEQLSFVTKENYIHKMMQAAFLLAYHGALRVGEFAKSNHLRHTIKIEDVKLYHTVTGTAMTIALQSFKHCETGATFRIKPSLQQKYCPVTALKTYLKLRPQKPGPLFIYPNGKPISRRIVANTLKLCLERAGYDPEPYNTHSFRVGKASDMAITGIPEALIRRAGRWGSDAYKKYIRFSLFTMPTTN